MQSEKNPPQRVAVVTGGAMGIGGDVCQRLAASGAIVLIADLNVEAAQKTARQLREEGGRATALELDVGRSESVANAFAEVDRTYGRCDVLVNSAGIAKVFPFLEFPLDNFVATMNVNVTGTLLCAQHAARLMVRNRWGRIVNIASVAGMRAVGTGRTAYGTSKGAVRGPLRITLRRAQASVVVTVAPLDDHGLAAAMVVVPALMESADVTALEDDLLVCMRGRHRHHERKAERGSKRQSQLLHLFLLWFFASTPPASMRCSAARSLAYRRIFGMNVGCTSWRDRKMTDG